MMQKKAQYAADTAPFYLVFGIVLSVLFLTFMWILAYYTSDTTKIPKDVEYDIITERFFSSNCFGHKTSELGIAKRNILSWYEFNQENLDYCHNATSTEAPAFRLRLKTFSPNKESGEIKTKNWDNVIGFDKEEIMDVLVYYDGKIRKGELIIATQWENVRFK